MRESRGVLASLHALTSIPGTRSRFPRGLREWPGANEGALAALTDSAHKCQCTYTIEESLSANERDFTIPSRNFYWEVLFGTLAAPEPRESD
jgi:hypothetical protein